MTTYTFAQLEALWIQAGGSKTLAPLMAGVAEVESGGRTDAYNASGASGLWQIEVPLHDSIIPGGAGNVFDAAANAKAAVTLSGNTLAGITNNWLDFEPSGAAQAIAAKNGGTVPASSVPTGGGGSGGGAGSGSSSPTSPVNTTLTTDTHSTNPLEEGLGAVASWIHLVPFLGGFVQTIADGANALGSVNHLIAYLIDYPLSMFKPGQAWRFVFTAITGLLAFGAFRTFQGGGTGGNGNDRLPLAILLTGGALISGFMAFRPWPNPDGLPIKPGAYMFEILEGQVPPAGPPAVSPAEVQVTEFALDTVVAIWAVQKMSSSIDNIATAIEEAKQAALGWWGNLF